MEKNKYQKYADYLALALKPHLQKKIGYEVHVYPSPEGGVVELKLGEGLSGPVVLEHDFSSLNEILKQVPQRFVAGNLDGVKLLGTNISMEGNRILFIKGEGSEWDEKDASGSVERVIELSSRAEK